VWYGSNTNWTRRNASKELGEKTDDEHEDCDWIEED
jgi:hypothetical protein